MKKFSLYLMVVFLLFGTFSLVQAKVFVNEFTDVPSSSTYYNAVMYLREKGIVNGYSDNTFKPDQLVNRAETMKMIMGIKDYRLWDNATDAIFGGADVFDAKHFSDLDASAWYIPYVKDAYNQGLVEGYPDKTMKPEQNVNTVEALKMLLNHTMLRIAEPEYLNIESIPYSDVDQDAWYAKFVSLGWDFNLLVVKNNQIFPGKSLSRGDLAEMIYRTLLTDENAWEKFQDISIKNTLVYLQDYLLGSELLVNGKSVKSLLTDKKNYIMPAILKVSAGKVLLRYAPTIIDSPVTYDAVSYSEIYDLASSSLKTITANSSSQLVVEDISRDGKNLIVSTYSDSGIKLLIIDANTYDIVKELESIKSLANGSAEIGDASYSAENDYVAWSETKYVRSEKTDDPGDDGFGYNLASSTIKVMEMNTGTVKTLYTDNEKILRVTGWKANGDVTYIKQDV